ncbi:O-antigen polymerase [Flavobacterium daejeonense]|uniref:O-antigen polymerase n=1 Tax=Flavobacterium daejeonense TaxID=350893 RepID=UPI00138E16E9|nr:O-antigen polymerase [Flavobacterium daejeonense]
MVFVYSYIRFNNALNPISILIPFIFELSYSFLQFSVDQKGYSVNTFFVVNLSIIFYLFFASIDYSYVPIGFLKLDTKLRLLLLRLLSISALITFVLECFVFGYIPILNITSVDVYNDTNGKLIPFLHYFILLNAILPSWSYIFYKEKIITKREFFRISFLSLFILLNYLSKQLYLICGITFFMTYTFYNKVSFKKIFRIVGVALGVFVALIFLRIDSESTFSAAELYRAYAGIENDELTLLESFFVLYSSIRFTVLDEMINFSDSIHFFGFGIYTFRPILSLFLIEKTGLVQRIPELDSELRVGTFLADPYLDFGFFGVIFLNAFYGFLALRYYRQYHNRRPEAIVKFAIIVFCILMGMFVNYFGSMLVWIGLLFNKIMVGGLVKNNNL